MRGRDQDKVYFECTVCGHRYQDKPNKDFHECPQCGETEARRI